jgi:hypothetical protein
VSARHRLELQADAAHSVRGRAPRARPSCTAPFDWGQAGGAFLWR